MTPLQAMMRTFLLLCWLLQCHSVAAAEPARPDALQPVRVQLLWKHQFEFAGIYAAIAQGYYREIGLDVTPVEYQSGMDLAREVTSGRALYGIGDSSLIISRGQGEPVVLLANIYQHSPMVMLSRGDSGIHSPAQMIGRRVMLSSHETGNASLIAMLSRESVSLDQLQILEHSFDIEDFIAGRTDVISAFATNEPGVLQQRQVRFNVLDPINYGIDFYGPNLFTSEREVTQNPLRAKQFRDATLRGWQYALQHPEEIIDLILERYSTAKSRQALQFEAKAIRRFILPEHIPLGTVDELRMERIVDTYRQLNMLSSPIDLESFLYREVHQGYRGPRFTPEEQAWLDSKPQIRVGVDPNWAPFEFFDEQGRYNGMAADYLELIRQRTGLDFQVQRHADWKTVMTKMRNGELDLLPAAMPTPQRREFLDFQKPHISYPMVILTRKDSEFISDLDDLAGRRIAVVEGYATEDLLRLNHPGLVLVANADIDMALKQVANGESYAFVDNLATITHAINRLGISNLRVSGTTRYEFTLAMAAQKGQSMLLAVIGKTLDSLGPAELSAIRDRWLSPQYIQQTDYGTIVRILISATTVILLIVAWNWRLSREIAMRKSVEVHLREATSRAQAATEAKSHFLATMSHEIRTPLNGVLGMAQLLEESRLDNQQKDQVEAILRSGRNLMAIINDVLDFSKLDAEQLRLERIPFDLEMLSHEALLQITPRASEKGLDLILDYAPTCPRRFLADPGRLQQVLLNLLGNSVKFTEQGHIRLTIASPAQDAGQPGVIELQVEDSGIGIPLQEQEHIFDSFTQADQATTRKYGGTGLGLAICKHLVKLMAGTIEVQSEAGDGACFRLRIPLDPDPGADEQYPQPGQLAGRRILLADEQPLSMQPLRLLLEHVGARCVSTDDGGRILELLQRAEDEGEAFDTLLLRQRRHSSNCLAMANYIRQQQTLRQPALLVLSAVGQRGEVMRFQQAGFDGYLRSPLLTSQLLGILQAVTRRHPGEPILTHHLLARAPDQRAPEPSFQGRVLLVEDVRVNQMVASQMLKKLGLEVELAEDGEQAVACWQQAEYDLIFMDCRMPNMDGYQATRLIRDRDQQGQHIPIIALTANATEDDRRRCLESGMDDIVTKPFHKSDLVQCLKQWLAPGAHA